MAKFFNTTGCCYPELNYMVDLSGRLEEIKKMVDNEMYFTINRGRQYGKTTILNGLADYLEPDYDVISMDFQTMSSLSFESEQSFVSAFSQELLDISMEVPVDIEEKLTALAEKEARTISLQTLFKVLKAWCLKAKKKLVLIIDEVDTAANNQIFLDFLAQIRAAYLKRMRIPAFQSVILAGVYDVRSIRRKIRPDEEHKENSPWITREDNEPCESLLSFGDCPRDHMIFVSYDIAAKFDVDMNFSVEDIAGMLEEYDADHHTGMDIGMISGMIYDYTSGYPYLVSRLCKYMDEDIADTSRFPNKKSVWTREGILVAVKMLLEENNPLFDSLMNKLEQFPELSDVISRLLFQGQCITYNVDSRAVRNAQMFGFVKIKDSQVQIANRIFETRLYNKFLLDHREQNSRIYTEGSIQKNQFIVDGHLDMRQVLRKFVDTFSYLYGSQGEAFLEEEGRRYFMLFLKPIINGEGNCYVEAETRNRERMDLVIDYHGEQSICELKIWRGNAYHERGEEQLSEYLDYFNLKKGYMLSFNFNKKKEIGVKEVILGDRLLIEAVV